MGFNKKTLVKNSKHYAAGLAYGIIFEVLMHKIAHEIGKRSSGKRSDHWRVHHRNSRKSGFYDEKYEKPMLSSEGHLQEAKDVATLTLLHSPVAHVSKPAYAGMVTYSALYTILHRLQHLNPEWTRKHFPWHYDHHMGPDQQSNWGVVTPFMDYLIGTRKKYVGTQRELDDHQNQIDRYEKAKSEFDSKEPKNKERLTDKVKGHLSNLRENSKQKLITIIEKAFPKYQH